MNCEEGLRTRVMPTARRPSCSYRVLSDNSVEIFADALRRTVIVVQHATHALASANSTLGIRLPERRNQFVVDPVIVPLTMVVRDEVSNRTPKGGARRAE